MAAAMLLSVNVAQASLAFYETGVTNSYATLPGGSNDPHYTLALEGASPPYSAAVVMSESSYWWQWPTPGDARWIYTADELNDPSARGNYVFRTTIDLTGYNPASAQISGLWTCDQYGYITLNGNGTGISLNNGDYTSMHPFSISSGFIAGVNTLEFHVTLPDGGDGLVVSDTKAVPLPPTALLMGSGLLGLGLLRFRKRA